MEDACLATESASRPRTGEWGRGRRRPSPRVDIPDRKNGLREMAPLYVEILQAPTPHLRGIAAAQGCSLWLVAKRTDMWLNRVLDTAENCRVIHALPRFLEALGEMPPDTWRACLHGSTSPVPRAAGEVDDAGV